MRKRGGLLAACVPLLLVAPGAGPGSPGDDVGPFVRALWLVQRYGTPDAADPRGDLGTKGALAKALGKTNVLGAAGVRGLIDADVFNGLAGSDGRLEPAEVANLTAALVPAAQIPNRSGGTRASAG